MLHGPVLSCRVLGRRVARTAGAARRCHGRQAERVTGGVEQHPPARVGLEAGQLRPGRQGPAERTGQVIAGVQVQVHQG